MTESVQLIEHEMDFNIGLCSLLYLCLNAVIGFYLKHLLILLLFGKVADAFATANGDPNIIPNTKIIAQTLATLYL